MILSCSWISLPCLSRSVIIRFFPRLCVLLTFFKLLDASIVSRISSKLCFRISSFAFFVMVLHISTYYMWSLGVLFSIISLRFFVRALVGDDMFGFFCFLVCFAMLNALCWIISVMFLFRLSMPSCSSSAEKLFFSSSWNVFYFVPIIWVSTLVRVLLFRSFLLSALVFSVMEPITILWSLPMLTRFMTVTSVTMLGLSVMM